MKTKIKPAAEARAQSRGRPKTGRLRSTVWDSTKIPDLNSIFKNHVRNTGDLISAWLIQWYRFLSESKGHGWVNSFSIVQYRYSTYNDRNVPNSQCGSGPSGSSGLWRGGDVQPSQVSCPIPLLELIDWFDGTGYPPARTGTYIFFSR